MKAALRVCGYLKSYARVRIDIDTSHPIPLGESVKYNWTELYGSLTEEIPSDIRESKGNEFTATVFVDADHASCQETC